jgi:hypothetical protein
MFKFHSFHIPVLGIGFSVDTPLKVAHLGIDSVISLSDDALLEKLRKMYSERFNIDYTEITDSIKDFRAKRITSYLNMINRLIDEKSKDLLSKTLTNYDEVKKYFSSLPDSSYVKTEFEKLSENFIGFDDIKSWLKQNLLKGSIDVNIMTKVDKQNYFEKEALPIAYNDAHAALRGFATSDLDSSVILSAGMSPRLYSYIAQFQDFFPNVAGFIKKKIILKVSDFRSAQIQGKFLAKKGIWVSEYRIESGLNCGGHAFATEGHLLGPILEEFKNKKQELIDSTFEVLVDALKMEEREVPVNRLDARISAQGGVGTSDEHRLLLDYYEVDSVGWGTPFLLVPEATNVDKATLKKLIEAKENDLYLSGISPLGVPFNNLRGNTKDAEKEKFMAIGRPGSSCPKKYLAFDKQFSEEGLCTASRQYQHLKIKELDSQEISKEEYSKKYNLITEKSCICVGLGTSVLLENSMETKREGTAVSICPGPNMAYFSREMTIQEITSHIYGHSNVISRTDRPNMFIKELSLYIDYLKNQYEEFAFPIAAKRKKQWLAFAENLGRGIEYYVGMFEKNRTLIKQGLDENLSNLERYKNELDRIICRMDTEPIL